MRKTRAHKPDIAIIDIRMPPTHTDEGFQAALAIREELPDTGVLVLSEYIEEEYAVELLGDDAAGVGYLLKDRVSDLEHFADAVRRVGGGRLRARPRGRLADAWPPPDQRPTHRADFARAQCARADGGGPQQPGDRRCA